MSLVLFNGTTDEVLAHIITVVSHELSSMYLPCLCVCVRNLLFLKDYDGDVSDLGLDFTVANNDFGETQVSIVMSPADTFIEHQRANRPLTSCNRVIK